MSLKQGRDNLPYYLLYAYCDSAQELVRKSPFFLLYGYDLRQPTGEALSCPITPYVVDTDNCKSELVHGLSDAWKTATQCIQIAQGRQNTVYDFCAKKLPFRILSITRTSVKVRFVALIDLTSLPLLCYLAVSDHVTRTSICIVDPS